MRNKIILLLLIVIASIYISNRIVVSNARGKTFYNIEDIPPTKVGLLLSTGKYNKKGYINQYYKNRITATVELYKRGKIAYILISGDNSRKEYNEPEEMKQDLIQQGIPENKIYLDYAGFRTLDSIIRAKKIFGQKNLIVISQKFHNERAIYIREYYGMNLIGFNAKDVNNNYGLKTKIREKLARVKMLIDLLIGKEPKFLGDKIEIK